MYCYKCGKELRMGAVYCDSCGANQGRRKTFPIVIAALVMSVGIAFLGIGIGLAKGSKNITSTNENVVAAEKDYSSTVADNSRDASAPDSVVVESDNATKQKEGTATDLLGQLLGTEPVMELPSLVTYSKERLVLGEYKEDKATGGYVQYFQAGSDTSIVQCIAEYKDMVAKYDLQCSGTLSSAEDGFNYTCYTFTYTGDAAIERESIEFGDAGKCDMCMVTAVKEGESYIAAYVPEGVTFVETTDHMRNSY